MFNPHHKQRLQLYLIPGERPAVDRARIITFLALLILGLLLLLEAVQRQIRIRMISGAILLIPPQRIRLELIRRQARMMLLLIFGAISNDYYVVGNVVFCHVLAISESNRLVGCLHSL